MEQVINKLKKLTNDQLIKLSEELRLPTVADDALIREVIKDSEMDTFAPMIAFVGVGQLLSFVLADRLIIAEQRINDLEFNPERTGSKFLDFSLIRYGY